MNIKNCMLLICCLAFTPNAHAKTVKTSVIIPCYYKHVQHVYALVKLYAKQTVLPDEVVISISEAHKADPLLLQALHNEQWPFEVKIVTSEQVQNPGENRNVGCLNATGDVFITQDADDVPHPQRVEIIKYFFENHEVDHLMHTFILIHNVPGKHKKPKIDFKKHKDLKSIATGWNQDLEGVWKGGRFHNGNIAFTREVFDAIKWSALRRREDKEFNQAVYAKFKNLLLVDTPLLCYRAYLSSTNRSAQKR